MFRVGMPFPLFRKFIAIGKNCQRLSALQLKCLVVQDLNFGEFSDLEAVIVAIGGRLE
jgi:hypothetical protein